MATPFPSPQVFLSSGHPSLLLHPSVHVSICALLCPSLLFQRLPAATTPETKGEDREGVGGGVDRQRE